MCQHFDSALHQVISKTVGEVEEIDEGLMTPGIRTWEDFIFLNDIHLDSSQKRANHKLVDTSTVSKDKIVLLHNMRGNDIFLSEFASLLQSMSTGRH